MNALRAEMSEFVSRPEPLESEQDYASSDPAMQKIVERLFDLEERNQKIDITVEKKRNDEAIIQISAESRAFLKAHGFDVKSIDNFQNYITTFAANAVREAKANVITISLSMLDREPEVEAGMSCYREMWDRNGKLPEYSKVEMHLTNRGTATSTTKTPKLEDLFGNGRKYFVAEATMPAVTAQEALDNKGAQLVAFVEAVGPEVAAEAGGQKVLDAIDQGTLSPETVAVIEAAAAVNRAVVESRTPDLPPAQAEANVEGAKASLIATVAATTSSPSGAPLPAVVVNAVSSAYDKTLVNLSPAAGQEMVAAGADNDNNPVSAPVLAMDSLSQPSSLLSPVGPEAGLQPSAVATHTTAIASEAPRQENPGAPESASIPALSEAKGDMTAVEMPAATNSATAAIIRQDGPDAPAPVVSVSAALTTAKTAETGGTVIEQAPATPHAAMIETITQGLSGKPVSAVAETKASAPAMVETSSTAPVNIVSHPSAQTPAQIVQPQAQAQGSQTASPVALKTDVASVAQATESAASVRAIDNAGAPVSTPPPQPVAPPVGGGGNPPLPSTPPPQPVAPPVGGGGNSPAPSTPPPQPVAPPVGGGGNQPVPSTPTPQPVAPPVGGGGNTPAPSTSPPQPVAPPVGGGGNRPAPSTPPPQPVAPPVGGGGNTPAPSTPPPQPVAPPVGGGGNTPAPSTPPPQPVAPPIGGGGNSPVPFTPPPQPVAPPVGGGGNTPAPSTPPPQPVAPPVGGGGNTPAPSTPPPQPVAPPVGGGGAPPTAPSTPPQEEHMLTQPREEQTRQAEKDIELKAERRPENVFELPVNNKEPTGGPNLKQDFDICSGNCETCGKCKFDFLSESEKQKPPQPVLKAA